MGLSARAHSYTGILRKSRVKMSKSYICTSMLARPGALHRYYSSSSSCTELALRVMSNHHCASARTLGLQRAHLSSRNGLSRSNPMIFKIWCLMPGHFPLHNFCSSEATDMPGTESESSHDYLVNSSSRAHSHKPILRN